MVDGIAQRLAPSEGESDKRPAPRPVHVVYGGAHLFGADSAAKIGARARTAMETWGADDDVFARAVGVDDASLAGKVAAKVRRKLEERPVEAICIDFEDGFGARSGEEEDAEARRAAAELARTPQDGVAIGFRIKSLEAATLRRAVQTLDLFLTTLAEAGGALRPGVTVTLPKVRSAEEVRALADLLDAIEQSAGFPPRAIGIELMIETPRAVLDDRGVVAAPRLVEAARGRAVCLHLGAYDLLSELGVTAQRLAHPFCDLTRLLVRLATPLPVADGVTTLLPVQPADGTPEARADAVHRAWRAHAVNVTRAVDAGIWQGWDLHPAQLPARYGALFAHFLANKQVLATRLQSFADKASRASRAGQAFDDAATVRGIVAFFERGVACGAFDAADPVLKPLAGLTVPSLG